MAKKNNAPEETQELIKIRVLLPLAGKFLLPQDPGAEIELTVAEATAIVDSGYAEFVK